PAQVATNWARQQAPNILPIIGSRRLPQIEDNLRTLDFPLSDDHLQRLNAALPLQPEYPDDFYKSRGTMRLAFGEAMGKLVMK
ncbi:MAG TPA: aldo/keto reductase, partial [Anaerolineales bacterium]|nr:aldo/keto reductase [Anaerolineales bacterium]